MYIMLLGDSTDDDNSDENANDNDTDKDYEPIAKQARASRQNSGVTLLLRTATITM
jgi:hypothetical protein